MKKVLFAVALTMGWNTATFAAQTNFGAQTNVTAQTNVAAPTNLDGQTAFGSTTCHITTGMGSSQEVLFDEFIEIEASELPQNVLNAVAEAYGTCVKEAYVSMSEEGLVYKLVLTSEDVEETVVLLNERGEWLM